MSFTALFEPHTIAIIGASDKPGTVGNDLVKNLSTGFLGDVIPINPRLDTLYGKKVFHDIAEVDRQLDLVVIAIPATFVVDTLEKAADKGASAAIVISAGFKEVGNIALEQAVHEVCTRRQITLIGPNCLGVINPFWGLNASFAGRMPEMGNVAFISQSGALCTAVLDYAAELNIGFSRFLSIGNKAVIDEVELLHYFATDKDTKVIAIYAESLTNAPRFIAAVQTILHSPTPKPVIIIKSGRTAEGAGAIASHTGSLAGGDASYEALFDQAGVIRAQNVSDLFQYLNLFSHHQIQQMHHVAIITNAGGPGVLTTDALIENGLKLATLSDATITNLQTFLPAAANVHNPVDILGDALAERYVKTLEVIVRDPGVDGIMVILTPQSMTQIKETAEGIAYIGKITTKPIVISFMGKGLVKPGIDILRQAGYVAGEFPESVANSLAQMKVVYEATTSPTDDPTIFTDIKRDDVAQKIAYYRSIHQLQLPEAQALEFLEAYGFPTLKHMVINSVDQATALSATYSNEVVLKIISKDILHKSDVGGVVLHVAPQDIAGQYSQLIAHIHSVCPQAEIEGVLVVEMAPAGGTELILGINKTPGLGTMLMVGLGGIYVEVFKDIAFAFTPLTHTDAVRMLGSLKMKPILDGARGQKPVNQAKLIECILRLSQLVTDFPEIVELDINPLLANESGALVLDGRLVLSS